MLVHRFDLKENNKEYTWHYLGLEIMESINTTEIWSGSQDDLVAQYIDKVNKADIGKTIIVKESGKTLKITKKKWQKKNGMI